VQLAGEGQTSHLCNEDLQLRLKAKPTSVGFSLKVRLCRRHKARTGLPKVQGVCLNAAILHHVNGVLALEVELLGDRLLTPTQHRWAEGNGNCQQLVQLFILVKQQVKHVRLSAHGIACEVYRSAVLVSTTHKAVFVVLKDEGLRGHTYLYCWEFYVLLRVS
jgi:hypothetical protein